MSEVRGGHALDVGQLRRSFSQGGETIEVLRGVDFHVARGEIVALVGASGAGKSTLLQAIGQLESGWTGSIIIDGVDCLTLSNDGRTALRRTRMGFVYQFHHLLPDFTAQENVVMPQLIAGTGQRKAAERARALLSDLGLGGRLSHRPAQLSGGEQQRVAVARALANEPALILADEPTGNLDEATSLVVLDEFLRLVRARGSSALVATHNRAIAARMDRTLTLHEGRIVSG